MPKTRSAPFCFVFVCEYVLSSRSTFIVQPFTLPLVQRSTGNKLKLSLEVASRATPVRDPERLSHELATRPKSPAFNFHSSAAYASTSELLGPRRSTTIALLPLVPQLKR